MNNKIKQLIIVNTIVLSVAVGFIVASYILNSFDLIECKFLSSYHLYCVGCGGTRAVQSLLQLKILDSILYNPIVPFGALLYAYYNIRIIISIKKNKEFLIKNNLLPIILLSSLAVIYLVLRNILLLNGIDIIGDVFGKGIIKWRILKQK